VAGDEIWVVTGQCFDSMSLYGLDENVQKLLRLDTFKVCGFWASLDGTNGRQAISPTRTLLNN
jgi:hypothetical protein